MLVVAQTDVSGRMEAETRMTELTEASLALLELIFPRHVIEYMALNTKPAAPGAAPSDLKELATKHDKVTLMFAGEPVHACTYNGVVTACMSL